MGGAFGQKCPPLSFLPTVEQGRGAARRRRPDSGALGHGGGRDRGAKEEEGVGARSPAAARLEAARGGLATGAGGGLRRRSWWRRCGAWWRPGRRVKVREC